MPGETTSQAIGEMLTWLERQQRESREEQTRQLALIDQLRKQVQDLQEQSDANDRAVRAVEPRFGPLKGIPEKIRGLDESTEHIRQQVTGNRAELENAIRLLQAEAIHDRQERADTSRRVETTAASVGLVAADISQVQAQVGQATQAASSIIERQREVENRTQQFGLRLDRALEVNRDMEERIRTGIINDVEDRIEVVFERMQVLGEMTQRTERTLEAVASERSMRQEVLEQLGVAKDQHARLELRVAALEEVADRVLTDIAKVAGEIALLEGRHSGLGERVAGIRRDIAEVVDHVRDEFAKYNTMMEKQRRKQIQVLEQELREMKFHAFRPPEEP